MVDLPASNHSTDTEFTFQYSTKAIELLKDHVNNPDKKQRILDLCPATNSVIQYLADTNIIYTSLSFYEKLIREYERIENDNEEENPTSISQFDVIQKVLNGISDHKYNVILTWDLFNYFNRKIVIQLMAVLSSLCSPGAFLHSFNWEREHIPRIPGKFELLSDTDVIYHPKSVDTVECSTFTPQALQDMMPSFVVHRTLTYSQKAYEILLQFNKLVEPPNPDVIPHFER